MSAYEHDEAVGAGAVEPGLELHEWETQWQQLRELAGDDPAQALPELADLAEAIVAQQGAEPADPVAGDASPDVVARLRSVREVADRVDRGEDVDPGDVAAAHEALQELHDLVAADRPA